MDIRNDNLKRCSVRHGVSAISLVAAMGFASASAQTANASASQASNARGAPQALGEVIVTAERRTANVQKTAAAITVQTGKDLLERGKFTLTAILETVPNVSGGESEGVSGQPTGNDSPAAGITIRGISTNGALSGQTVPGVTATAVYVDGVYGGLGGEYDIDRVEVLRGPQGTLYGRSATAGVVAIHTYDPDLTKYSGTGSVEIGNLGLYHESAAVNLPIIKDELALRVSADRYERNGADSKDGLGATLTDEARAKLLFRPTDYISLLLGGALQDRRYNNGGVVGNLTTPNDFYYETFPQGVASTRSRQIWAQADLRFDDVKLTYLPAFRTWTQNATVYVPGPFGLTIKQLVATPKDDFLTQELRLASDGNSAIKWQTGLFYYQNDLARSGNLNTLLGPNILLFDANISRNTYDFGTFAEGTLDVTDRLRLTGGLRYDKTTVKTNELFTSGGVTTLLNGNEGVRDFSNVTYKGRIEYDLSPTNLIYGMMSSSFLPGDVQVGTGLNSLPAVNVYQSEGLTAYEIGSKNRFLDQRLQINADIFYYNYGGYQLSILLNPTNPGSGALYNVPMHMTGEEFEGLYQITAADRIGLNFSHIDAPFYDRPAGFATYAVQTKLWGFSPTTATFSYGHDFVLANGSVITLHGEGIWRDGYDVNPLSAALAAQGGLPYVHQNAFVLGNLDLTWVSGDSRFSVTGYVRNVSDYRYKTYVNLQTISPAVLASGTESDPRTFGAVLTAHF